MSNNMTDILYKSGLKALAWFIHKKSNLNWLQLIVFIKQIATAQFAKFVLSFFHKTKSVDIIITERAPFSPLALMEWNGCCYAKVFPSPGRMRLMAIQNLSKEVKTYKFLQHTCVLHDILKLFTKLSKSFQAENLNYDKVETMLQVTRGTLNRAWKMFCPRSWGTIM